MSVKVLYRLVIITIFLLPVASNGESHVRGSTSVSLDEVYQVLIELSSKTKKSQTVSCFENSPGIIREKNEETLFIAYSKKIKQLKRKGRSKTKAFKKLKKLNKKGKEACNIEDQPTFDENENTTTAGRIRLKIPSGFTGNITLGELVHQKECTSCHSEKRNRSYPWINTSITQAPMFKELATQEVIDLTAYLSRSR